MTLRGRRLVVVTGKGGVGRTTLTLALGHAAAEAGLATCVVELSGSDALARAAGLSGRAYAPRPVAHRLDLRSLTAAECVADFASRKLGVPRLLAWIFDSRLMTTFVAAVPGLHDLVQLGKIENQLREPLAGEPRWDLTILDGPATGHGLTLLAGARAMRDMTRLGPFHELAAIIEDLLASRDETAILVATLPEALPVHEALELCDALVRERGAPEALLVNLVRPPWPSPPPPARVLDALAGDAPATVALREVATATIERASHQEEVLADLAARAPAGTVVLRLPRLDEPAELRPLVDALRPLFAEGA